MDFIFNMELAPTHFGDKRLSPFERYVIVALHRIHEQMTKTATAIAALQAADANLADAFTTLSGEVNTLITTVTDEPTAIADAVKAAIAEAGGDPDDAVNAAAIQAAADADTKLAGLMSDLGTHAAAAEAAAAAPAPPAPEPAPTPTPEPEPAPEPAALVFNGPTSITGTSGTPLSGNFSASGGTGPYTFAQDGAVGDFQTTADGFFAMNPTSPVTSSVNIVVTDSTGAVTDPASVSISVG